MRLQLDDDLKGVDYVGFQCALLYTSPKGDRRIRVHTMSLPVSSQVNEIHANADGETSSVYHTPGINVYFSGTGSGHVGSYGC